MATSDSKSLVKRIAIYDKLVLPQIVTVIVNRNNTIVLFLFLSATDVEIIMSRDAPGTDTVIRLLLLLLLY